MHSEKHKEIWSKASLR